MRRSFTNAIQFVYNCGIFIAILSWVASGMIFSGEPEKPHFTNRDSWYSLLSDPKSFEGKRVTLSGIIISAGDRITLFPSDDDVKMHRYENSISVAIHDAKEKQILRSLPRMGVVLSGVFHVTHPLSEGHPLSDVVEYSIDFWRVENFATTSPFAPVFRTVLQMPLPENIKSSKFEELEELRVKIEMCLEELSLEVANSKDVKVFLEKISHQRSNKEEFVIKSVVIMNELIANLLKESGVELVDLRKLFRPE